jgi:transcriptional regulator with XRE-family HTH domain
MLTTQVGILQDILDRLTAEDRRLLREAGISRQLIYAWRNGERLPTEPQAAILAIVSRADRDLLAREIALLRATPQQLGAMTKILRRVQRRLKK